ncbi:MAG: hypothetical protein CL583_04795 [Alteromonadaceae bacterium]|nr:hypothetical protein [Alteromonadaceae bacterium]|tara:strand:- start:4853 stop:5713 length:861 start_codon:yes stop_codon:yes gene_type:complete
MFSIPSRFLRLWVIGLICFTLPLAANAVSTNFRAQGHYYSAKEALESGQYDKAINYVKQSKEALKGTNQELQYLHIVSAYNAGKFKESQDELHTFFEIVERQRKEVEFDRSVDRLSDDEVRSLTMLINRIDEQVAQQQAKDKQIQEDNEAAKNLSGQWYMSSAPSHHFGSVQLTITQSGNEVYGKSAETWEYSAKSYPHNELQAVKISETDKEIKFEGSFFYTFEGYCSYTDNKWLEHGGSWLDIPTTITYDKAKRAFNIAVVNEFNNDCQISENGYRYYTLSRRL